MSAIQNQVNNIIETVNNFDPDVDSKQLVDAVSTAIDDNDLWEQFDEFVAVLAETTGIPLIEPRN